MTFASLRRQIRYGYGFDFDDDGIKPPTNIEIVETAINHVRGRFEKQLEGRWISTTCLVDLVQKYGLGRKLTLRRDMLGKTVKTKFPDAEKFYENKSGMFRFKQGGRYYYRLVPAGGTVDLPTVKGTRQFMAEVAQSEESMDQEIKALLAKRRSEANIAAAATATEGAAAKGAATIPTATAASFVDGATTNTQNS